MTRLPPVEKFPLALRKNVRDEWENNKEGLEAELSGLLGTAWTIDINPLAIWPYHNDGYAKESLGNCIKGYASACFLTISTPKANLDSPPATSKAPSTNSSKWSTSTTTPSRTRSTPSAARTS
jgi:hypothetical protein